MCHPIGGFQRCSPAASASVGVVTARLTPDGRPPAHEVHIEDGRFSHAVCTCGWRTAAKRDRRSIRAEARDHALLYAVEPPVGAVVDVSDARDPQTTV